MKKNVSKIPSFDDPTIYTKKLSARCYFDQKLLVFS